MKTDRVVLWFRFSLLVAGVLVCGRVGGNALPPYCDNTLTVDAVQTMLDEQKGDLMRFSNLGGLPARVQNAYLNNEKSDAPAAQKEAYRKILLAVQDCIVSNLLSYAYAEKPDSSGCYRTRELLPRFIGGYFSGCCEFACVRGSTNMI